VSHAQHSIVEVAPEAIGTEHPAGRRLAGLVRGRVRILVAADLVALAIAITLVYVVADLMAPPSILADPGVAAGLLVAGWLGWVPIFLAYQLYERETRSIVPASFDEVTLLFHALLAGTLGYLLIAQALARFADVRVFTPIESVLMIAFSLALVPTARAFVRARVLPAVMVPRRTLIVGSGKHGRAVQHKLESHPEYGLQFIGFVDAGGPDMARRIVGSPAQLTELVDELEADWVVLATSEAPHEELLDAIRAVRRPDVQLSIVPTYSELFASNAYLEDLEGLPVVSLPSMRLSRSVRALKRSVDVVGAGVGLLLVSPLLAVVAVMVKLDSPGPVFFRQQRRGRGGTTFRIVKFRTMCADAESQRFDLAGLNELNGPLFKIKSDPRVTRVGGALRRWSLDEIPQLWNVLRGDMSLVGPRPFVIHEAQQITGWAERRLDITPGITGLWQVSGRNDMPFDEMVKLDYVYVTNWSLWWDIKILFQTLPVVLARRGAY
jgi:exopolysaccharide biosynthesis polyprenyl glycosylphosphotransferase